jgi:prepilin-type N-terminal cleavage/methylation domain-containing protein
LRAGFTLIEMMVVIALVVVLMAAAVPLFVTMGEGSAMRGAVTQVRGTLSLARQYAISRNEVVYFLIAGHNEDYGSTQNHVDKCLRAYAVYSLGQNMLNSNNDRKDDKYLTEWEYLPPGIVFDVFEDGVKDLDGNNVNILHEDYDDGGLDDYEFKFPNSTTNTTRQMNYIRFTGDGRAAAGSGKSSFGIVLAEGGVTWPESGNVNVDDASQYFIKPNGLKQALVLGQRSGRVVVEEVPQ